MIALGLSTECGAVSIDGAAAVPHRNGDKRWHARKDSVRHSQNLQCLVCGQHLSLEIHHVRKIAHGGTDALRNLVAVCHIDHRLIHDIERETSLVSRLILILSIIGPESLLVAWASRFLFARFLRSSGTAFNPAELAFRPARVNAVAVLACMCAAAVAAFAQAPHSPDAILVVQEREAHERAVAGRVAYQAAKQSPKAVVEPEAPRRHLSPAEVSELSECLERYFRENVGGRVPVFWSPGPGARP
jgi:hypothetical protein